MKRTVSLIMSLLMVLSLFTIVPTGAAEADVAGTGKSYNLWLGTTQVTDENKSNILGDNTASFDSATSTLTLNNPQINSLYRDNDIYVTCLIYANKMDLTIKGSLQMTESDTLPSAAVYGEYCNITFDGAFTLWGKHEAVWVKTLGQYPQFGSITVAGGYLNANTKERLYFSLLCDKTLLIKSNVEYVTTTSYINAGIITVEYPLEVVSPKGGSIVGGSIYEPDGTTYATNIDIRDPKTAKYDLWLGNTQVTYQNRNDILRDGGKAKYDPDNNILTLNNPNISDAYYDISKIHSGFSDLTIKGSYKMTSEAKNTGLDVRGEGTLTLDGDFTFLGKSEGIFADGNIVINSGTLVAKGTDNAGIYAYDGDVVFSADVKSMDAAGGKEAIHARYGSQINDKLIITTPAGAVIKNGLIYESDGRTYSKHVVIQKAFNVSFNANGGSGTMDKVKVKENGGYFLPECTFTAPSGKYFKAWEIDGTEYQPNDMIYVKKDTTVKALWVQDVPTVNVTATDAVIGGRPSFTVTSNEPSKYFIDTAEKEISWYNWTDGKNMTASDRFEDGKNYSLNFKVTPKDGYAFAYNTEFKVNGKKANLSSSPINGYVRMYYMFEHETIKISSVDCTITEPVAGKHPDMVALSSEPEKYTCTVEYWYTSSPSFTELDPSIIFEEGIKYAVCIKFTPNPGYEFVLNGLQYTVNGGYAGLNAHGRNSVKLIKSFSPTPTAGYTVGGSYTSYLDGYQATKIELLQNETVKYATASSGNSGSYSIPNVASGTYTLRVSKTNHVTRDYEITVSGNMTQEVKICPIGDVNMNGKVQSNDAMAAYKHAQGNNPANLITDPYALKCADVKGTNGKVQSNDAMEIYKQAQGKHSLF